MSFSNNEIKLQGWGMLSRGAQQAAAAAKDLGEKAAGKVSEIGGDIVSVKSNLMNND